MSVRTVRKMVTVPNAKSLLKLQRDEIVLGGNDLVGSPRGTRCNCKFSSGGICDCCVEFALRQCLWFVDA